MAQGNVTATILTSPFTTTSIKTAVEALRVTGNDRWIPMSLDHQLTVIRVEEA